MRRWILGRRAFLLAGAGPLILFQQGCAIDPDIILDAALTTLTEISVFVLDNALVAFR